MAEIEIEIKAREHFKSYLRRKQRWACNVVHRRGGKTYAAIQDICARSLSHQRKGPPKRYAYIAPTRDQAKDVAWGYLTRFMADIPGVKVNESELRINLHDDTMIRLYSGDNYDRMRGLYFDGVVIDEPADIDPQAWPLVILPCLSDYQGWATFIGTPKGKNAFYEIYKNSLTDSDWFSMTLKASESGIIPESELEQIKRGQTPEQHAQEYECDFSISRKGAIYAKYIDAALQDNRINEHVECYDGFPVYTAFDIGAPYNQKCWIFQIVGDSINLLASASGGDDRRNPADWALWLKQKPYRYGGHFLPHDGEILWRQQMADAELANVVVLERQKSVWDGINDAVQAFSRCRFNSIGCKEGLDALDAYHSKEERDMATIKDVPVHDWSSHYADAFSIIHQAIRRGLCVDRQAIPRRAVQQHKRTGKARSGMKL